MGGRFPLLFWGILHFHIMIQVMNINMIVKNKWTYQKSILPFCFVQGTYIHLHYTYSMYIWIKHHIQICYKQNENITKSVVTCYHLFLLLVKYDYELWLMYCRCHDVAAFSAILCTICFKFSAHSRVFLFLFCPVNMICSSFPSILVPILPC